MTISELTAEKARATACLTIFKAFPNGRRDSAVTIRQAYADAKTDFEGAVAGLVARLMMNNGGRLSQVLRDQLARGIRSRHYLCALVAATMPDTRPVPIITAEDNDPGRAQLAADNAVFNQEREQAMQDLLGALGTIRSANTSANVAATWIVNTQDGGGLDDQTRDTAIELLQDLRWPAFEDVSPDQQR
jgi:hypothetical protein